MASLYERLALVIQGDATSAVRAFNLTGDAAKRATTATQSGMDALKASFKEFTKSPLAWAAAGAVVGKAIFDAGRAASNLNEQMSATRVTFGAASGDVIKFGKSALDSFGLSTRAALEASNSFAALFKQAGIGQEDIAGFSTTLTKLGADLSSFKNIATGDVLTALRSGLTGELEPLRRLGIILNDSTTTAKALALGLGDANGKVDDGAKVIARYAQILEQTKDAQGDYARTADQAANAQRTFAAALENFQASLGQGVAPAIAEVALSLKDLIGAMESVTGPIGGVETAVRFLTQAYLDNLPGIGPLIHATRQQRDSSKDAEKAQKEYAAALAQSNSVSRAFAQATKDAAKDEKDLTAAVIGLVRAKEGQKNAQDSINRAVEAQKDAQRDLNRLLEKGAVDADQVASSQRSLRDATRSVASAIQAQADAQAELDRIKQGASKLDLREAELDLAEARRTQEKASLGVSKAQDALNRLVVVGILGQGQQAATALDVASANLEIADAKEAIERADIGAQRAQERLTELQRAGKEGSRDLKDAQDALKRAVEGVAEAQERQLDAQTELSKAMAGDPEFQEKVREAREKVASATENIAKQTLAARDAAITLADAQAVYNDALGTTRDVSAEVLKNFQDIAAANKGLDFSAFTSLLKGPASGPAFNPLATFQGLTGAFSNPFGGGVGAAGGRDIVIQLDGRELARVTTPSLTDEMARVGRRNGG